ncbi:MAG: Crp/Fnr family transcriptional regulator [Methanomassiliicoccaceae archaeon]|jgi:CRP-like cAMP-binding protein|nr:Crp/Fnr family transcriptional regulator [Methanomassiliicoccaceae archaeon]
MNTMFEIVKNNPLFHGIAVSDFEKMIRCMSAETKRYKKNDIILRSGDAADFIGIVTEGNVMIKKEDPDGRVMILDSAGVSESFAEVFACAGISQSPVTVQASEDCEVLFLDHKKTVTSCTSACPFHTRLIRNLLELMAHKNLSLSQKLELLSKRTTREKILCFFDTYRKASKKFTIPYDREKLAQYLCVDRSAMSNELCKMRREGLIKFNRNTFEILQ